MNRIIKGWAIILIATAFLAGTAGATDYTWYVDGLNGSDSNSGTNGWGDATKTIRMAVSNATAWLWANTPNQTRNDMLASDAMYIIVRAGTYVEGGTVIFASPGFVRGGLGGSTAPLYIQSEHWSTTGKWETVIMTLPNAWTFHFYGYGWQNDTYGGVGNWYVRGFTFRSDYAAYPGSHYGIYADGGPYDSGNVEQNVFEAINCDASHAWAALNVAWSATIRSNIIHKIGSGCEGASLTGIGSLASNARIYDNLIYLSDIGNHHTYNLTIRNDSTNCVIHHNVIMGKPSYPYAAELIGLDTLGSAGTVSNIQIYANILANGQWALNTGGTIGSPKNIAFFNNTIYQSFYLRNYGDPDTFFNNIIVTNKGMPAVTDIYYDGLDHTVALGYSNYNDGTNYLRVDKSKFVATTLWGDWYNRLPSEMTANGFFVPTQMVAGISGLDGYTAPASDVRGVSYGDTNQMGAVAFYTNTDSGSTQYVWYVDGTSGNDTNSGVGGWANATKTISNAIGKATTWLIANTPSGTREDMSIWDSMYIIVRAGTYHENVHLCSSGATKDGLGGSRAPLYFQSEHWSTTGKWETVITTSTNGGHVVDVMNNGWTAAGLGGVGNIYIRGFTLRSDYSYAPAHQSGVSMQTAPGDHVTVDNNIIEAVNCSDSYQWLGVYPYIGTRLYNNIIRKLEPDGFQCHGIATMMDDNEMSNNLITVNLNSDAGGESLYSIFDAYGYFNNNRIHHNVIMGYPAGGFMLLELPVWNWPAAYGLGMTNNVFYANILYGAGRVLDNWNTNASFMIFYNNTFYAPGSWYMASYANNSTWFNNIFAGDGGFADTSDYGLRFNDTPHNVAQGYNNMSDGTNYFRGPSSMFVTTTLPDGWTNKLPNQLTDSGWLQPKSAVPGMTSLNGYTAPGTDIYGVRSSKGSQMGAVYFLPKGVVFMFH